MTSYNKLNRTIIIFIVLSFGILFLVEFPRNTVEKRMFPSVVGDMILENNESGIQSIRKIVAFDNFSGNIQQGYTANYTSRNATMIIFVAQMADNTSAKQSLENMAIRNGYKNSSDTNFNNNSILKLPVQNPTVYVIKKNKNGLWHYAFAKKDKVYWIGFNNTDINYQASIMMEAYLKLDE